MTPRLWANATAWLMSTRMRSSRPEGELAACRLVAGGEPAQDLRQADAVDQLHGEEEVATPVGADVVHRDDAGVLELAGDLRLLDEALALERVALPEHHLHRHRAVEREVDDLDDRAHAAAADLAAGMR